MRAGLDRSGQSRAVLLARRLVTCLCHDLSGPLGALGTALAEVGADAEALALADEAGTVLRRRLALLRAAWGEATESAMPALGDLMEGFGNAHRLRLRLYGPVAASVLPGTAAQVVLNVLLLAATCLPEGGSVGLEGDPARELIVQIAGERAGWPDGFGAMLADPEAAWEAAGDDREIRPAQLQAVLTALLIHEAGVHARLLLGRPGGGPSPLLLGLGPAISGR